MEKSKFGNPLKMDTEMKPNIYPEIIGAFFQISSSVGSIHFRNNINMETELLMQIPNLKNMDS